MNHIRAITFDMDGTLYDLSAVRWRFLWANRKCLAAMRVGRRVRDELRPRVFTNGAAFLDEEARMVAERLGVSAQDAAAQQHTIFNVTLAHVLRTVGPRTGTRALLESLREVGVKLGVISDRAMGDKLHALGLDGLFDVVITADECGAQKPHERPFLLACERLHVQPEELLHVGDRPDTDVEGAVRVGAQGLLVQGSLTATLAPTLTALRARLHDEKRGG
jgi:HAD superfamily hydrolase (TIGR01509 family)